MDIKEFRKQYPEYNDMSDQALADSLYQKHYSDMDRNLFNQKFLGVSPLPQPQEQAQIQPNLYDPMAESMAMFSPKAAGMGAAQFAPEIGLMAGAMAPFPVNIPATGLGYAAGNIIKEGVLGQPQKPSLKLGQEQVIPDLMSLPTMEQTKDFGKGMAYEATGQGLGWMASKAFKPIQQGFQMLRAGQLAEKGLPIPASAISPTEQGLVLAKKARETYPGNKIVQEAHEKIRTGANEMLNDFKVKYGINQYSKEAADKAFNDWAEMMGGADAVLDLPKTTEFIAETMNKPFVTALPEKTKNWWTTQAATFVENPTVQGLRDIWSTLGIKGASGADKTSRNKLAQIISDELKSGYGEEAAAALDFAKNQNAWAKKVYKLKGIINGSHTTVDGVDTFMPDRFSRLWEQLRSNPVIFKNFSGTELAEIDEFAQMMGVIGNELKQKVSDKGAGSLLMQGGGLGAIGTGLQALGLPGGTIAATGAIGVPGLQYLLSHRAGQIYNPASSVYRRMMGEPMAREIIPGLVNIGGKLMLLEGNKLLEEK